MAKTGRECEYNLSFPYNKTSVNRCIPKHESTVQYNTVFDAIKVVHKLGKGAVLAKSDIKSAFQLLPIKQEEHLLLGFKFENAYYYYTCMAMGCSSSCLTFEKFGKALQWILVHKFGIKHCIQMLDDFLFIGESHTIVANDLRLFQKM